MRKSLAAPIGAALVIGLLGACSKPASQTAGDAADATANAASNAASDAAAATSDAAATAAQPGGVVSAPQGPKNDPVNADANTGETNLTKGSNSFTEGQARGHIENAGYTNVSALTKTPDGLWTGQAMKDGKSVAVSLDFKGVVTAK